MTSRRLGITQFSEIDLLRVVSRLDSMPKVFCQIKNVTISWLFLYFFMKIFLEIDNGKWQSQKTMPLNKYYFYELIDIYEKYGYSKGNLNNAIDELSNDDIFCVLSAYFSAKQLFDMYPKWELAAYCMYDIGKVDNNILKTLEVLDAINETALDNNEFNLTLYQKINKDITMMKEKIVC